MTTMAVDAPQVIVEGAAAQRIAELWRELPAGRQKRCHIPPLGIRFHAGGRVVTQASICWMCNNVAGEADGTEFWYEFDASNARSRELLAMMEQAVGHPVAEG